MKYVFGISKLSDIDNPVKLPKIQEIDPKSSQLSLESKSSLEKRKWSVTAEIDEMKQELDNLRLKVCSRARAFLIVKMNNLRKPKTNFQILQESVLLKYKPLLIFLKDQS
jgi:hypothetical protein